MTPFQAVIASTPFPTEELPLVRALAGESTQQAEI
jgi:hypothetical protein